MIYYTTNYWQADSTGSYLPSLLSNYVYFDTSVAQCGLTSIICTNCGLNFNFEADSFVNGGFYNFDNF